MHCSEHVSKESKEQYSKEVAKKIKYKKYIQRSLGSAPTKFCLLAYSSKYRPLDGQVFHLYLPSPRFGGYEITPSK